MAGTRSGMGSWVEAWAGSDLRPRWVAKSQPRASGPKQKMAGPAPCAGPTCGEVVEGHGMQLSVVSF